MTTWLTDRLRARLKVQEVPFELVRGPERLDAGPRTETRIVLERDDTAGDSWGPRRAALKQGNATLLMQRTISMTLKIYAQATCAGPSTEDHEELADRIADQLGPALDYVVRGKRPEGLGLELRIGRSFFLTKEQIKQLKLADWPGRIYMMPFEFDTGVYDSNFVGDPPESVVIGPDDVPIETTVNIGEEPGPAKGLPEATTEIEE